MKPITHEARDKVYGERAEEYGEASKYMPMVAGLWSQYTGTELNVTDVCVMLAMLKMTRLKHNPDHRDSKIDICGYMEVSEKAKQPEAAATTPNIIADAVSNGAT